jgi:hypothetical protein
MDQATKEMEPMSNATTAASATEEGITSLPTCKNGCEIDSENALHSDGYCDACHEYPEG